MSQLLLEAESFRDLGGWVVDQQSIEVMGSPYLLAHGLGEPVANARTTVAFPAPGDYRVWVRTRDWVPPFGPGKFRLRVNGTPLAKTFGADGDGSWRWHAGGTVKIADTTVALELEDLTGFDGRCDAILFTTSEARPAEDCRPPVPVSEAGTYDFVVAGGGYAGVCAAVAAARLGLAVALIPNRPVLGGNASSEVRVGPIGGLTHGPFPRNADIMHEIQKAARDGESSGGLRARPNDAFLRQLVENEKSIRLFLETHLIGAEKDGPRLVAVTARHIRTGDAMRLRGALFADCTGHGTLGALADADWAMGREGREETAETLAPWKGDGMLLGVTNYWYAQNTARPTTFPDCPWALRMAARESFEVSTPKYPPNFREYPYVGGWNWETGWFRDPLREVEQMRDHNLRAIYGTWDFLKNRAPDKAQYANAKPAWAAFIAGTRESRRLLGDLILTQQDIEDHPVYPDGCVTATWYFDLHFPHPENTRHFPGQEFRSLAYDDPNFERFRGDIVGQHTTIKPYPIPYRCFYSRNVPNLFMAGRNISVTHVGLAPVRVMNTTGMMGTMVGRAASLCRRLQVEPRALYTDHLAQFRQLLANPPL